MTDSLYARAMQAGLQSDHYESDLYLKASGAAWELVNTWQREAGVHTAREFASSIDGSPWIEIPFAFAPWWEERRAQWWRGADAAETH